MKFSDKYPEAKYLEEVQPGIIRVNGNSPCWNCGQPTSFADIDFGAPICSEECSKAKNDEFWEAYNK